MNEVQEHDNDLASSKKRSFEIVQYNPNETKKQRRVLYNDEQKEILEKVFKVTSNPDFRLREQLGRIFNRTSRSIQIWFQNKRSKKKKVTHTDDQDLGYAITNYSFKKINDMGNGMLKVDEKEEIFTITLNHTTLEDIPSEDEKKKKITRILQSDMSFDFLDIEYVKFSKKNLSSEFHFLRPLRNKNKQYTIMNLTIELDDTKEYKDFQIRVTRIVNEMNFKFAPKFLRGVFTDERPTVPLFKHPFQHPHLMNTTGHHGIYTPPIMVGGKVQLKPMPSLIGIIGNFKAMNNGPVNVPPSPQLVKRRRVKNPVMVSTPVVTSNFIPPTIPSIPTIPLVKNEMMSSFGGVVHHQQQQQQEFSGMDIFPFEETKEFKDFNDEETFFNEKFENLFNTGEKGDEFSLWENE